MRDYSNNFANAMNGHIGIPKGGDDPKDTTLDQNAEIRDIISGLTAQGKKLPSEELSKYAIRLSVLIGKPAAQKLVNHILVFNQRGDVQSKTPEERIDQFYKMGALDKETDQLIAKAKSFGYGPQQGLKTSPDILNIEASKRKWKTGDKGDAADIAKIKTVAPSN